jgi:hypothetical protein
MAGFLSNLVSSGAGAGGIGGSIASFMGGPWGAMLGGLGGLFGGMQTQKMFDEGRQDIMGLPGMQGPSNLMGDFGTSIGGQFGFNNAMGNAQQLMQGTQQGLFQGQNPFANVGVMDQYQQAMQGMQTPMGAGNAIAAGGAGNLFGQGMQNLQAAGNTQGIYDQQLDLQRQAYAPQAQRERTAMFDDLFAKGLLGSGTNTGSQNSIVRQLTDSQSQADLGFQQQAFARAQQEAGRLGGLGMQQTGQGLGAENQAFQQAMGAGGFNQQQLLGRLGAAQSLFGQGQEQFAQNYGLGLQGAETMLGFGDFGLRGAAMPYQLQAGLLSGSGYHSQALAGLTEAQASANAGFMGGLFG